MRYDNHLRYAVNIISHYKGELPLAAWLKNFFHVHKQMGSADRRTVSELIYCFYRLGRIPIYLTTEIRILAAVFVCNHESHPILEYFKPVWNMDIASDLQYKLSLLRNDAEIDIKLETLFPYTDLLSKDVDPADFERSFLTQPKLFLRIRPRRNKEVEKKLTKAKITYIQLDNNCLELPTGTKADSILLLDDEAVVQDYSSQQTGSFLKYPQQEKVRRIKAWDCCAASGGKSIMAWDLIKHLQLTVSDKRETILENLHKRFANAGIKNYKYFIADLSKINFQFPTLNTMQQISQSNPPTSSETGILSTMLFDLIICDVPCTGSGTWARSPEQLYFFNRKQIEKYSVLQKQILTNVIRFLAPGGKLLFITCSVFKKENEDNIAFIQQQFQLQLEKSSIFKGYSLQADTMFAALFTAPAT